MSVDPFSLIEQGYEIFPVRITDQLTDKKKLHFLTKESWNIAASKDPERIAEWRSRLGNKITDWCIPTGHRNGITVIDIDSAAGQDDWDSRWLPEGREIPTPRGGTHIFYSIDGLDIDVKTGQKDLHPDIDTRGEGGFVVAYSENLSNLPELPAEVADVLPEKQVYKSDMPPAGAAPADLDEASAVELPNGEVVLDVTPPEARVLKGFTDILDALPRPWVKGAGYHNAQFGVACALNRIANSPFYRTDHEAAYRLFVAHAPLRDSADATVRDKRWTSAVEATVGQWFDPPTDVPVRLPDSEAIDLFTGMGSVDRLYWEGRSIRDVKDLIRDLRELNATPQQAYTISYESSAMRTMREKNPGHTRSTWGFVKEIYNMDGSTALPGSEAASDDSWGEELVDERPGVTPELPSLLTADEGDRIRVYPNFIDRYIMTARTIFAEPNLPLHYVNAWISLSASVGDRADIMLTKGRVPLSLWGLLMADSAAGKGDGKVFMVNSVDCVRRGGFADASAGGNASAEGMSEFLGEREGKVTIFHRDEARSLLDEMHREGSYEAKMMDLALDLYDGKGSRSLRVGSAKEGAGAGFKATFLMWLQTTWAGALAAMRQSDVESGFVGRFLVAIGDGAKITEESLRPEFASEYQVESGGIHPMLKSLGDGVNAVLGNVKNITVSADDDVIDRYVKMRLDVLATIEHHSMASHLRGVMLRVTENMLKGAALLAVSEGRGRIEMPDMLIAIKSGQYWVRDAIRLVEAISTTEYRRRVDSVIELCTVTPRTRAEVLHHFKNLPNRDVIEALERAEQEGSIKKTTDGKRWAGRHGE